MRQYATQYHVDPYRFVGERRRFSQDVTHPDVIYEPGKCIMCDACVRIAAEAGEELGVATIGRGFTVAMGVPFGEPLAEGLKQAARRAAEKCPTGALALRSGRSCDLGACGSCPSFSPEAFEI
jgi:NADH dehydrogenase/NADH:ubiquinone oxidoreductase subunit G